MSDLLDTLLHTISSDNAAAIRLPSILSSLSSYTISNSSSLNRWTHRVSSLIHSKEYGARWAGLVLALETARMSQEALLGTGQEWITTVLPLLSKNERVIVWKACIRLITYIFTSTANINEFQRQVVVPNVPKFSTALMQLAEKRIDEELTILCLNTLRTMVIAFSAIHRPIASTLSSVSLSFLNGSPLSTPIGLLKSASRLHACLHLTSGKVAGPSSWRKSVEETVEFCRTSFGVLRTTFAAEGSRIPSSPADPLELVALNVDRLYCGIQLLRCLLRENLSRPAVVPIGMLVKLCIDLMSITGSPVLPTGFDPSTRSIELAAIPSILELGCDLASCLIFCTQRKIIPHFGDLISISTFQLEQKSPIAYRLPFVKLMPKLFSACPSPPDPFIVGRLLKTILPALASLLSDRVNDDKNGPTVTNGKKGKKRARDFEGDEIFKARRNVLCQNAIEVELVLASLEALPHLLRTPKLPAYLESMCSRLLLSLLFTVPKLSSSSISHDASVKHRILQSVKDTCLELTLSSTLILSKSTPLVIDTLKKSDLQRKDALFIDLMLHPRMPPIVRPIPPIDTIALRKSDESVEEGKLRKTLGLDEMEDRMEVDGDLMNTNGSQSHIITRAPIESNERKTEHMAPIAPIPDNTHDAGDNNRKGMLVDQSSVSSANSTSKTVSPAPDASLEPVPSITPIQRSAQQMAKPSPNPDRNSGMNDNQRIQKASITDQVSSTTKVQTSTYQQSLQDKASFTSPRVPIDTTMGDDEDDDEFPTIDPRSDTESESDSEQ